VKKTFNGRMSADLTPFLEFFTKGFLETVTNLSQYVRIGKIPSGSKKPMLLDANELALLDFVYQFGVITTQEAIGVLSAPKRTTQRRLMKLVEKEILAIKGQGSATQYVLKVKTRKVA